MPYSRTSLKKPERYPRRLKCDAFNRFLIPGRRFLGDVSQICKSALFEMSLRRYMRRPKDASEMHLCRLDSNMTVTISDKLRSELFCLPR